jgi:hypothetical protein
MSIFQLLWVLVSRYWKRHFLGLSNDLKSEMAITESPYREIRQNGEQSVACGRSEL